MYRLVGTAILASILAVCAFQPVAGAEYSIQSLGVAPGYDGSWATDINDVGGVICGCANIQDLSGVFIWNSGSGLTNLAGHGVSAYAGINDQGQTAGVYTNTDPHWKFEPLIRNSDGAETRLHVPEGVSNAWVEKILDDSSIFLTYEYRDANGTVTSTKPAIIDTNGSSTFIEVPGGNASISAVSNNGTVIVNDEYLWTVSGGLSTLSWLASAGQVDVTCVNDLGWVVGTLNGHAVRWDNNGNTSDLGVGVAKGINNNGQVVGSINDLAVMWNADGSVTDLPSLAGYSGAGAFAINDSGQVVGEAWGDGAHMAVLWQSVPEPSSCVALVCGLVGILARTRKRRSP